MGFYLDFWKNYFKFSGVASRRDFWLSMLVNVLIYFSLFAIAGITGEVNLIAIATLFILLALIPSISIQVRKLHDVGKSGWWWFINIVPLGFLYLLYLSVISSVTEDNPYLISPASEDKSEEDSE
jgi:uncharacterized membrane protein YhaH (DUF805 family)